ncbi:NAD synthetase [Lysinibacillus xylanilyticus]|uniref:NAD synthetase n=1 Tax=Lysinibacillus xylanilyticus TaxID=582475 RepID=A0ABT4ETD4_9BACI|nr:NAD synthetase [Lysinibacillus xylanilyticus]MCY9548939.1 NAD synthetase [Lysinibacillus xylanilyticus]
MRTSRVSSTTSSIFRNEQQYLHAGDLSHNFGQNPKQQFKNSLQKNKDKKHISKTRQIQQQRSNKIAASYVDSAYDLQIRNELNETAVKLSLVSKQKKLLNSYRSSI